MMKIFYKGYNQLEVQAFINEEDTDPIVLAVDGDGVLDSVAHFFGLLERHKDAKDCPLCNHMRMQNEVNKEV